VLEREQATSVRYAQGRLLFLRGTTLFSQTFDAQRRALLGDPVAVAERVEEDLLVPGAGAFTVSETGVLAYQDAGTSTASRLVWFDRGGKRLAVVGDPLQYSTVNLSPDGSRATFAVAEEGQVTDVWIVDVRTGHRSRFTFDPGREANGTWSPDGTRIAYDSAWKGQTGFYQKASTGAGTEGLLFTVPLDGVPTSWSPDGRSLLYTTGTLATSIDLWILPLTGTRKPYPFLQTAATEGRGQFSPDGQWIAYASNEGGLNEVYVMPFPGPGGKFQISTTGGDWPRWRRDGKEIFYISQNKLTAAAVRTEGGRVEVGAVTPLFDLPGHSYFGWDYDVSPDGQRFLVIAHEQAASAPINLVVNWTAGLKK
jgi:eukaryotic-like serine/threonine-protein kinase